MRPIIIILLWALAIIAILLPVIVWYSILSEVRITDMNPGGLLILMLATTISGGGGISLITSLIKDIK